MFKMECVLRLSATATWPSAVGLKNPGREGLRTFFDDGFRPSTWLKLRLRLASNLYEFGVEFKSYNIC